jgi:hypothetical protein
MRTTRSAVFVGAGFFGAACLSAMASAAVAADLPASNYPYYTAPASYSAYGSAKAEWLYLDLATRSYSVTGTNNALAANVLRLGVNYRF